MPEGSRNDSGEGEWEGQLLCVETREIVYIEPPAATPMIDPEPALAIEHDCDGTA